MFDVSHHPRLGSRRGRGRPPSRDIRFKERIYRHSYVFVLQVQLGGQNDPTRGMGGSTGLFVLRCSLLRFDDFELKESAAIL